MVIFRSAEDKDQKGIHLTKASTELLLMPCLSNDIGDQSMEIIIDPYRVSAFNLLSDGSQRP
jgi:hypothetical protein